LRISVEFNSLVTPCRPGLPGRHGPFGAAKSKTEEKRLSQSSQSTQRKPFNLGENLKGYAFPGALCALARKHFAFLWLLYGF
jgi:hypothetical protein